MFHEVLKILFGNTERFFIFSLFEKELFYIYVSPWKYLIKIYYYLIKTDHELFTVLEYNYYAIITVI